jgi:UDP-glucose 4-epimerase
VKIAGGKFLVTGGASLIGSHLARRLLDDGAAKVILYDNLSLGSAGVLASFENDDRVTSVRGDILRLPMLIDAAGGVDGIFALAGFLTLPLASDPALGVEVNAMGALHVLDTARLLGRKVVFASSIAVYGNEVHGLVDEDTPFGSAGTSPAFATYASTKLLGENLGRLYAQKYGVATCSLRFSTVYGENQHARGVNALYILEAMQAVRAGRNPVVRGDGDEAHDYLYAGDAARALALAMEGGSGGEAFNIVTGQSTTVNDIVRMVLAEYGSTLEPTRIDDTRMARSTAHPQLQISNRKARENLGWEPRVGVADGIHRLREWLDASGR